MKSIAVFCGANDGARPAYVEAAREVGVRLGARKLGLIYGGGGTGMMGALADAALAAGASVVGVMPEPLVRGEVAHRGISELRVVATMHERKSAMYDRADGFMILPGGIGTMDELFEVLVWLHLGYHRKPVGLLDVEGFFDRLIDFLDHMEGERFLRASVRELVLVERDVDRLLDGMAAFVPPPLPAFMR
jgi:uncharacterized protein (TIGR00730 family)